MIYRVALFGIVGFWVVMMGLLVRLEVRPDATDILDVPVSYVGRIMFKHEQQSLLTVREQSKPIGTVMLRPTMTGTTGAKTLDFSGSLSLQLSLTAARQRFNFTGGVNMDRDFKTKDFHLELTTAQPSRYRVAVKGDTGKKTIWYEVRQGDGAREMLLASSTLPMDSGQLVPALLHNMGIEMNAVPMLTGGMESPAVTARESQITLHGEQLAVYRVTVSGPDAAKGGANLVDVFVSQLGQIVIAKTSLGYSMAAEDYQ